MSFWHKLFTTGQHNEHKNQIVCIENDCSYKSNEQLLDALRKSKDDKVIQGIKKVLIARGYSRRELMEFMQKPI